MQFFLSTGTRVFDVAVTREIVTAHKKYAHIQPKNQNKKRSFLSSFFKFLSLIINQFNVQIINLLLADRIRRLHQ